MLPTLILIVVLVLILIVLIILVLMMSMLVHAIIVVVTLDIKGKVVMVPNFDPFSMIFEIGSSSHLIILIHFSDIIGVGVPSTSMSDRRQ